MAAQASCFATAPGTQKRRAAELFAAIWVLRSGSPPATLKTDYEGLVDGVRAGKPVCVEATYRYAELWTELRRLPGDLGEEALRFVKMKAHVSPSRCVPGSEAWRDAVGNELANRLAKRGAKARDVDPWPRHRIAQACHLVGTWAVWLGAVGAAVSAGPRRDSTAATGSRWWPTGKRALELGNPDAVVAASKAARQDVTSERPMCSTPERPPTAVAEVVWQFWDSQEFECDMDMPATLERTRGDVVAFSEARRP